MNRLTLRLKRWTRFSLRFFLLAVTLIAAWTGVHVRRANEQRQAVKAFTEHGGWIRYDFELDSSGKFDSNRSSWAPKWLIDRLGYDFFHSVEQVSFVYNDDKGRKDNPNVKPAPLEHLRGVPKLRRLFMKEGQATDDNLRHVAQLRKLEWFYVWDAIELGDEGVQHLVNLQHLSNIHIGSSRISDASLRVFGQLKQLKRLTLQFSAFSDDGISHLKELQNLESLWVCGVEKMDADPVLTDRCMDEIAKFKKLNRLGIQNTKITDERVAKFKNQNPNCKISH